MLWPRAYFHEEIDAETPPMFRIGESRSTSPPLVGSRLRGPASPKAGPFPFWSTVPSMAGAAFFDLDRTLLAGASGPVLADAMRRAGLGGRAVPGERLIFGLFNTVGETLPRIALPRQAAGRAKGRSQAAVQAAAVEASEALVRLIQPFAAGLFAEHRDAGRA